MAQVLVLEPEEIIKFQGGSNIVVTTDLKLTNPTTDDIGYKVKTTAPTRYAVRPNSGVLRSGESTIVSVMRQPYDYDPNERVRHKFMIQSVVMQPEHQIETVWNVVPKANFMETKLKVQFDDLPPSNRTAEMNADDSVDSLDQREPHPVIEAIEVQSSITDDEYHKVVNENNRLSQEVSSLRTESQELKMLANKSDAQSDAQPGITLRDIAIIIGLLVIAVAAGLYAYGQLDFIMAPKPTK